MSWLFFVGSFFAQTGKNEFREYSQGTRLDSRNVLIMNILHLRQRVSCQKIARYFQNTLSAYVCRWFKKYPVGDFS